MEKIKVQFSKSTPFRKVYMVKDPQNLSFIKSNREIKSSHVKSIVEAFKINSWIPPIYITKSGEILDGQNRYLAFLMAKEQGLIVSFQL